MARPEPEIIHSQEQDSGDVWQILHAQATYVITYKNKPINIRVVCHGLGRMKYKYKRVSYTELGTVENQVRRYNKLFNCQDFDYIVV
mgnify:CR=1 FL=1